VLGAAAQSTDHIPLIELGMWSSSTSPWPKADARRRSPARPIVSGLGSPWMISAMRSIHCARGPDGHLTHEAHRARPPL